MYQIVPRYLKLQGIPETETPGPFHSLYRLLLTHSLTPPKTAFEKFLSYLFLQSSSGQTLLLELLSLKYILHLPTDFGYIGPAHSQPQKTSKAEPSPKSNIVPLSICRDWRSITPPV